MTMEMQLIQQIVKQIAQVQLRVILVQVDLLQLLELVRKYAETEL